MFRHYCTVLIACGASVFVGCASAPMNYSLDTPAQFVNVVGTAPISDGRAQFRQIFCALLSEDLNNQEQSAGCEDYLLRLSDETNHQMKPIPAHNPHFKILLVPGAFGECVADEIMPYDRGVKRLKARGYDIDTIMVSGLSSSDYNASQIAEAVINLASTSEDPLILIGYSKGATDILHFLVKYPLLAERVTAVLSVAGAINGSPVADKYAETYARWFYGFSLAQCEPGDGGVVESLTRSVQLPWLATHRLPDTVKYFSLVSFTHRERIALALLMTYDDLTRIDPRNDGQLLFYDQLVPGSTLLGYANADHWAVAIPVQEYMPFFGGAETGYNYPRAVLFEAMILYLTESLEESKLSMVTGSTQRRASTGFSPTSPSQSHGNDAI